MAGNPSVVHMEAREVEVIEESNQVSGTAADEVNLGDAGAAGISRVAILRFRCRSRILWLLAVSTPAPRALVLS